MRFFSALLLSGLLILGLASAGLAADPAGYGIEIGFGARALGMGGAFVAVADDGTACYWNPAGITQFKLFSITPALTLSGDWQGLLDAVEAGPPYDFESLELDGMLGANLKGFGLSVLASSTGETNVLPDDGDGRLTVYGTGLLSWATEFKSGFSVGLNIKTIYGRDFEYQIIGTDVYSRDGTGTGYGVDVGAMIKIKKLVRIGFVVQNAYGQVEWDFNEYLNGSLSGTSGQLDVLTPVLHVGIALQPPLIGTLIAVQADRALAEGGSFTYRIGLEQTLLLLKLRVGARLDENFVPELYTAGLGFKLGPVVMDAALQTDPALAFQTFMLTAGITF